MDSTPITDGTLTVQVVAVDDRAGGLVLDLVWSDGVPVTWWVPDDIGGGLWALISLALHRWASGSVVLSARPRGTGRWLLGDGSTTVLVVARPLTPGPGR